MKEQEVRDLLAEVTPGTTLRLVYKEGCTFDPYYLLPMERAGFIQFTSLGTEMTIMAIQESKDWGHPDTRTIEIITTKTFDLDLFVARASWPLESLEIVEQAVGHPKQEVCEIR